MERGDGLFFFFFVSADDIIGELKLSSPSWSPSVTHRRLSRCDGHHHSGSPVLEQYNTMDHISKLIHCVTLDKRLTLSEP